MFWKVPIFRLCSTFALSLAAFAMSAPSALAADCSCMCVDATPLYVCTGFVPTQTQTAECDVMECPTAEDPPADPVEEPVEEPVATIEPPHPGLECERRSVYRPDLGRYKRYKVCRPSADGERRRHRGRHQDHARNHEEWAARRDRMRARWEARMARHRHRQHNDRDDDHDG